MKEPTRDTSPAILAMRIEGYRRMTVSQKLEIVCALNHTARELYRKSDAPLARPALVPSGQGPVVLAQHSPHDGRSLVLLG